MESPEIRYATSGGVDIAYTVIGSGPVDVVYVPGFISHLDLVSEIPAHAAIIDRFGRFARVLTFDKRGTGLSGRDLGFGSLAERSDDIRAVMDAAGWERAYLVGVSEGAPLSLLFASLSPERVRGLVLYGGFAKLLPPGAADLGFDVDRFVGGITKRWGNGRTLAGFLAAPDTDAVRAQLGRYERSSASPALAAEIMRRNFEIDARPLLPFISAPTLVVHQRGDPRVDVERGRELAAAIAGARLVELDGNIHCGWTAADWAPAFDAIEEFVTGAPPAAPPGERVLATVLFTDIVDSTRHAAEHGDREWRALLDEHDAISQRTIDRYRGHIEKDTGDGLLATFDGPGRAVQCARALVDAAASLRLHIRAGLHTGEIERRGDDVAGIGVHIAARISALASADEVLVSRTVRDLVVGSDLVFDDRGTYELKGVPDTWQVYAAR